MYWNIYFLMIFKYNFVFYFPSIPINWWLMYDNGLRCCIFYFFLSGYLLYGISVSSIWSSLDTLWVVTSFLLNNICCIMYLQVGYIVTSSLLNENHDFLRLAINTVRNDIIGRNETFQCLALTLVCFDKNSHLFKLNVYILT